MSYQKIVIVGNLGRDPEMRYTPTGQGVTNFSVATNRQYTASSGEKVKETTWFRVSAWGRQAETCNQYLKSGSRVLVEGRMNPDKETGNPKTFQRQDGSTGSSYEIVSERVVFLTSRDEQVPLGSNQNQQATVAPEDEIPF